MQLQPVTVVALGVPALQSMREPAMGYPNNVVYPGMDVAARNARLHEIFVEVTRARRSIF